MGSSEIKQSFFVIRECVKSWYVIEYIVPLSTGKTKVRARTFVPEKQVDDITYVIHHTKLSTRQRRMLLRLVQNCSVLFLEDINYGLSL